MDHPRCADAGCLCCANANQKCGGAFGQFCLAQSTGEMWVASDGGYIVKYLVTTKGDANYFGEGIDGTLRLWSWLPLATSH